MWRLGFTYLVLAVVAAAVSLGLLHGAAWAMGLITAGLFGVLALISFLSGAMPAAPR